MKAIEDDIEGEATRLQELALEPVFAHCAEGLCAVPERIRYQTSVVRPARLGKERLKREKLGRTGGRGEGKRWEEKGEEACVERQTDAGACDEDQTDSGWHGNGNDLPSCS